MFLRYVNQWENVKFRKSWELRTSFENKRCETSVLIKRQKNCIHIWSDVCLDHFQYNEEKICYVYVALGSNRKVKIKNYKDFTSIDL